MKTLSNRSGIAFAIAAAALTTSAASYADLVSPLQPTPASLSPIATQAPMLAATWAGQRAVSVGGNGIILLSDNRGKSFRQAQWVPISSTLTGVSFADAKSGWAVGHWGLFWRQLMAARNGKPNGSWSLRIGPCLLSISSMINGA